MNPHLLYLFFSLGILVSAAIHRVCVTTRRPACFVVQKSNWAGFDNPFLLLDCVRRRIDYVLTVTTADLTANCNRDLFIPCVDSSKISAGAGKTSNEHMLRALPSTEITKKRSCQLVLWCSIFLRQQNPPRHDV
jgi:hypothetical protein